MKLQYHDYNSELEYICGKVHLSFCQMVAIIMTIITLGLIFVFHEEHRKDHLYPRNKWVTLITCSVRSSSCLYLIRGAIKGRQHIFFWPNLGLLYLTYSTKNFLCHDIYRVVFLTVPPNLQFQNEKRWPANQRFCSMKFWMYKRSLLVERFSF